MNKGVTGNLVACRQTERFYWLLAAFIVHLEVPKKKNATKLGQCHCQLNFPFPENGAGRFPCSSLTAHGKCFGKIEGKVHVAPSAGGN